MVGRRTLRYINHLCHSCKIPSAAVSETPLAHLFCICALNYVARLANSDILKSETLFWNPFQTLSSSHTLRLLIFYFSFLAFSQDLFIMGDLGVLPQQDSAAIKFYAWPQDLAQTSLVTTLKDALPHSIPIYNRILAPHNTPSQHCLFAASIPQIGRAHV